MAEEIPSVGQLAGLCYWDGSNWQKVEEGTLAQEARLMNYDGSAWRKSNLLWGYNDRYSEYYREQKDGDGQYTKSFTAVPSGYVYVVNAAWIANETTAAGSTSVQAYDGTNYHYYKFETPTAAWEVILFTGTIILKAGDALRFIMNSCLDDDWIRTGAWGYKMQVAM